MKYAVGPNDWHDGPSWATHQGIGPSLGKDRGHPKGCEPGRISNANLATAMVRAARDGRPMPIPPVHPWVIDDIRFLGEYWAALARKQEARTWGRTRSLPRC